MEQSPPWEPNSRSASQDTLHILCNPKVYCHVHKNPPPTPNQMNLVYTLTPSHHFNISSPSTPLCSTWCLPFTASVSVVCISYLSHVRRMPRPSHSPWFYQVEFTGYCSFLVLFSRFVVFSFKNLLLCISAS